MYSKKHTKCSFKYTIGVVVVVLLLVVVLVVVVVRVVRGE